MTERTALITGASGYVGAQLVPALLDAGWRVRALARTPDNLDPAWRDRIDVVEGDATDADAVRGAMEGVDAAWFLLHSMDGHGDYAARDRALAHTFADAARDAGVGRLVYLSGLHPAGELSTHLASRVEVGEILLASGVPTAVLQAGVVLGDGSASFDMLRHLTERLPVAFGPKWLRNRIHPIAIGDVVHYLVRAADLDPSVNRTFDLGMDEQLTYIDMMRRYARVTGLMPRLVGTVPVLTPGLASLWVGLITPVKSGIARPLVGSLIHDAVKDEDDASTLLGDPPGGPLGFDDAVRAATRTVDPHRWGRTLLATSAAVGAAALARNALGASTAEAVASPLLIVGAASAIADLEEDGRPEAARAVRGSLAATLALAVLEGALRRRVSDARWADAAAVAVAASSADLARRGAAAGPGKAVALGVHGSWWVLSALAQRAQWGAHV